MSAPPPAARTVVLLPTFNEAGNIRRMLSAIRAQMPDADVLVIDDNSPDGTGELAETAAIDMPGIHVAHRPGKQGLGVAYRFGYRWALDREYERIIQMDCDFSHDPRDLPRMANLLDRHSVVIGSRRVPGGGAVGWPWYRNLISAAGSVYARAVLSSPVADLTTGFKGYRADTLAQLPLDELQTDGFGFQIEVTAFLLALGHEVYEMPIRFKDRTVGQSKMSTAIFVEALFRVWQIRGQAQRVGAARS